MLLFIDNRKVKIVTGRKSQTVNVYVNNDTERLYNPKLRINDPANFVTGDFIDNQNFSTIEAMVSYLVENRGAVKEDLVSIDSKKYSPATRRIIPTDKEWAEKIIPKVENAINQLVDDFINNPYQHRVEHSLHCQLFQNLMLFDEFNKLLERSIKEIISNK